MDSELFLARSLRDLSVPDLEGLEDGGGVEGVPVHVLAVAAHAGARAVQHAVHPRRDAPGGHLGAEENEQLTDCLKEEL